MKNDNRPSDDQMQDGRGDKVNRKTIYLADSDMERMADGEDEDYRMPRDLPKGAVIARGAQELPDDLITPESDISPEELQMLERAEYDYSSDETLSAELLDETDEDGDVLNESSGEEKNFFDTGEDLDMPNSVMNPDINQDEEDS